MFHVPLTQYVHKQEQQSETHMCIPLQIHTRGYIQVYLITIQVEDNIKLFHASTLNHNVEREK